MRKLLFSLVSIFLFLTCDRLFELENKNSNILNNPVIIEYDKEKEESVQEEWNNFLLQYNANYDTSLTHFMNATSFISQVYFKEYLPKIFFDINDATIVDKLLQFYSEWDNLFGCKMNNIELDYTNNEQGVFTVRFRQIKINNTFYNFTDQPFIKFTITEDSELRNIISTLIPDADIEMPKRSNWVNISKMIDNTIGLEYEFPLDASSIYFPQKHIFSKTDKYHVNETFEIYPNYSDDTLLIYYLKGIKYSWHENNLQYSCTVYYHPETTEIIYIKKW